MSFDLYTLDENEETVQQVIAALTFGLSSAFEGELISPENEHALRSWMRAEQTKHHPQVTHRPLTARDMLATSPWWQFWSALKENQEVRWLGTKTQTYFCTTGHIELEQPEGERSTGPWVELRRHTGKTFWSTVFKVRPLSEMQS
jgi:hypothetical protein